MNANEAAELLAHASGFDNRKPSVAAAVAWASALHDIPLDADTKAAVAVYYTTPPRDPEARLWILPHHVRTLRAKLRNARLENFVYTPPLDDRDRDPHYLARLRGQAQAIASGHAPAPARRPAIEADPKRDREFVKELEARGWEGNRTVPDSDGAAVVDSVRRAGPLGVECPACHAAVGRPCKMGGGSAKYPLGKPCPTPHSARLRAAQGIPEKTAEQRAIEEQAVRARAAAYFARQQAEADDIPDAVIVEDHE